jgi:hypothetical protein
LSASTNKKVIVERFEREVLRGFVNPQTWLREEGIELLSAEGAVVKAPFTEVKVVSFVKDLDGEPVSADRRLFTTRPKTGGLWVRMLFRDGDHLDGILANELLGLDPYGFHLSPPESNANTQRVYVPRAALTEFKVLGVIGSPLRRRKRTPPSKEQITLFE